MTNDLLIASKPTGTMKIDILIASKLAGGHTLTNFVPQLNLTKAAQSRPTRPFSASS